MPKNGRQGSLPTSAELGIARLERDAAYEQRDRLQERLKASSIAYNKLRIEHEMLVKSLLGLDINPRNPRLTDEEIGALLAKARSSDIIDGPLQRAYNKLKRVLYGGG